MLDVVCPDGECQAVEETARRRSPGASIVLSSLAARARTRPLGSGGGALELLACHELKKLSVARAHAFLIEKMYLPGAGGHQCRGPLRETKWLEPFPPAGGQTQPYGALRDIFLAFFIPFALPTDPHVISAVIRCMLERRTAPSGDSRRTCGIHRRGPF